MSSHSDAATTTVPAGPAAFSLRGRRAVVTGASTGIGSAIAIALGAAGAHVAGIDKTGPEPAADHLMLQGDTGRVEDVERLAAAAVDAFGGIDIWVNNAARLMVKPLLETTDEDWHGLLAANLHGYFYRPDRIYHLDASGHLEVVAQDPQGTLLGAPTNVCFTGPRLDRVVCANLGRWHLTLMDLGLRGAALHRPERWALDALAVRA